MLLLVPFLQLQFERGQHGKPFLLPSSAASADQAVASRLQFNLAHTQSVLGAS
jgi:phosphopantetheinyl transferase